MQLQIVAPYLACIPVCKDNAEAAIPVGTRALNIFKSLKHRKLLTRFSAILLQQSAFSRATHHTNESHVIYYKSYFLPAIFIIINIIVFCLFIHIQHKLFTIHLRYKFCA